MYSQFEPWPLLGDILQFGFLGIVITGLIIAGLLDAVVWIYRKGKKSGLKREKRRAQIIAQELKALEGDK